MRTIYDGLSFEVVKEAETFLGTRGITSSATGEANLNNYTPQVPQNGVPNNTAPSYPSDHTKGTRYYYIPNNAQGSQTRNNGETTQSAPSYGSDHTKGTRYYYIPDNAQGAQIQHEGSASNTAPPYPSDHTRGTRYYYIPDNPQSSQAQHSAIPVDRTKGVRTYLYLNGERVAINNLYNTNHGQYYYGSDILGSVKFITGQGGQELKRIEYDVFGGIYKGASPYGLETGYTGKPYDAVTGLTDYGFRDYSPKYARFITEDPIRDGENWFAYVGNNPVNFIDPWGLSASDGKKVDNKYEGDLKKTRIRYMQWTPAEGEGVLGSYTFDVYTSIKKDTDVYKLDVWVIAVSGPHIRHDDTKYYGTVTLNVDGQQRESKPLQSPKESFLIESTSVMVGEANFQFPQQSNTNVTIKNTGYIYSNPEGYQLSWPSADTKIDIKE